MCKIHEYTIWLPIIMGDDLRSQWLVFVMFIKLIIGRELCPLKTLELKFWLKFIIFRIF